MKALAQEKAAKATLTFEERLAALEEAIDKYHLYLERYLTSLTRNHADAEDLLSRLWVIVLHKFKDDQIGNLPILRRKAYQLFIDHYRAKMRERDKVQNVETLPEPGIEHLGKEAYTDAEEIRLKEKFWTEFPVDLPAQQKEVLWLSARYGFTIQEISARLSLPHSTIGDWLQRSRKALADYVAKF